MQSRRKADPFGDGEPTRMRKLGDESSNQHSRCGLRMYPAWQSASDCNNDG
ncbi:hypothetical protein BDZ89DRAFT_1068474, partial [Hymenopellis radicata]